MPADRPLTQDEILREIARRQETKTTPDPPSGNTAVEGDQQDVSPAGPPTYRYVRPLLEAADGLIETIQNVDGRFMFGISEIDNALRGIGRGELMYVTGRAHSGKTQLVLQAVVNAGPEKRVLFFTPDEVAELVLSKLVSMSEDIDAELLEKRIKDGDQKTIDLVRYVATTKFPNFLVIDDSLTFSEMTASVEEAEDYWGGMGDLVVIDFLELLLGGGNDEADGGVSAKSRHLKSWGKNVDMPIICIHQASRSSGKRGQAAGMNAMRYGGETDAIYVLEVFRKIEDETLDDFEKRQAQWQLTVNVAKNKRPPCKKGQYDLYIDPRCGYVRRFDPTTDIPAFQGAEKRPVYEGTGGVLERRRALREAQTEIDLDF
jgi:replicative DNA helicase